MVNIDVMTVLSVLTVIPGIWISCSVYISAHRCVGWRHTQVIN